MTRQEFISLAKNPPKPTGPSFFRLQRVYTRKKLYAGETRYPQFPIWDDIYYLPTLAEAEKKMRRLIAKPGKEKIILCYYVYEIPFGYKEFDKEKDAGRYILSWRAYDENGVLFSQSQVSCLPIHEKTPYGQFLGRSKEEIRFKEGDLVDVIDLESHRLLLSKVEGGQPLTWEKAWKEIRNGRDKNFVEYIYDRYGVVNDPVGFDFYSPRFLLKPHFPVSKSDIRLLKKAHERSLEDDDNEPYLAEYLSKENTGLAVNIYVTPQYKIKHPYIKFQNDNEDKWASIFDCIPMRIRRHKPYILKSDLKKVKIPAAQVEKIKEWVVINYDILMTLWNGTYVDVYHKTKKI